MAANHVDYKSETGFYTNFFTTVGVHATAEENLEGEMAKFQKEIELMMLEEEQGTLDLKNLDRKRRATNTGDATVGVIKMASIQGTIKDAKEEVELYLKDYAIATKDMDTSSEALLNYFSLLGSADNNDEIDLEFLDVLCIHGNVLVRDVHGQSIMHEIAREWSTDIAAFVRLRGMDIDMEDKWGRTPLFVAAASNYTAMITWLVEHGADINHKTMAGEGQCPIHFTAKYDAVEAFDTLLKLGADPLARDDYNRTPFYLAAEAGFSKICSHFLELELPVASYCNSGVSTIDYIVENLPTEIAWKALNQFVCVSRVSCKVKFYLSCLGKRRWKLLNSYKHGLQSITPPGPLEIILRRCDLSLINHPVISEMIKQKLSRFGNYWINVDLFFHFLFTMLWTICVSIRVSEFGNEKIEGQSEDMAVLVLAVASQAVTSVFLYKLYREWKAYRYLEISEKRRMIRTVERCKQFCHPRWISDTSILAIKEEAAQNTGFVFWCSGWRVMEVVCLFMSCVFFILNIAWYICERLNLNSCIRDIRLIYSAVFVIVVWIRINRSFRSSHRFGPFVAMIGQCLVAGVKILFLFIEFYIPLSVAFWVAFGGKGKVSGSYQDFHDLLYEMWKLAFIGDYDYDSLFHSEKLQAQLLLGIYIVLVSIITINIYVALLSEAVSRINETASQRSLLAKAMSCQKVEITKPENRRQFEIYLNRYCAPMIMDKIDFLNLYKYKSEEENPRAVIGNVATEITALNRTLHKLTISEAAFKAEITMAKEQICELKERYGEARVKHMLAELSKILTFHGKPLIRVAQKTDDHLSTLFDKCHIQY